MFYGGSNLQHLNLENNFSSLASLNTHLGIVMDSDKNSTTDNISPYKSKIKDAFTASNKFCWLTEKREIENYIPHSVFVEAVQEGQTEVDKVIIDEGNFVNKTKFKKEGSSANASPKIKLSNEIFSVYQREDSIKSISAKELKKELDKCIKASEKSPTSSINKISVAKRISKKVIEYKDSEWNVKMNELVVKIKRANDL